MDQDFVDNEIFKPFTKVDMHAVRLTFSFFSQSQTSAELMSDFDFRYLAERSRPGSSAGVKND